MTINHTKDIFAASIPMSIKRLIFVEVARTVDDGDVALGKTMEKVGCKCKKKIVIRAETSTKCNRPQSA